MFTLNDLLRWRADLHPAMIALVDDQGHRLTYQELYDGALRAGRRWMERGVQPGDVVALLDTNSIDFVLNLVGLARVHAIPALLNWRLTPAENEQVFELINPVAVGAHSSLIARLPDRLPDCRIAFGEPPAGWTRDRIDAAPEIVLPDEPLATQTCALAFSSGTTGRVKAIPWRHESLTRSVMVDSAELAGMQLGDRHLGIAPIFHLAGLSNLLMGLSHGAEIHLRRGFDPAAVLKDIEQLRVAYMTVVPAMLRTLVRVADHQDPTPDTSLMREITYGASPISPELIGEVNRLFPDTGLRQFYGMTEIGGALTTLTPDDHRAGGPDAVSAGRVNPGFQVKLVDRDGNKVPDGEPGQIMVKGHTVMKGYWKDPVATADAIVDGWFATGDIARRDRGYLTIMDRAKDMIVSGGENVYPAEVEAALDEHPSIADIAVIGVLDERFGERVHAVVVARPETSIALEELQAFGRERLAGYKLPRSLEIIEELPRNATGKVLKRDLQARYGNHG